MMKVKHKHESSFSDSVDFIVTECQYNHDFKMQVIDESLMISCYNHHFLPYSEQLIT